MRDAFGGAFMLKLALVFLVIYVSFMAVAINYAKTFRVKNQIINIIEQYQFSGTSNDPAIEIIDNYLAGVPHVFSAERNNSKLDSCHSIAGIDKVNAGEVTYTSNGACIISYGSHGNFGNSSRYYKVVTFFDIDFKFFNIKLTIPISGETKVIYQ